MALFAAACGSSSNDVASLAAAESTEDVKQDSIAEVEAAWLALAQCLRDNGLEVKDPVFDSDGIVQKPGFVEGAEATNEELKKGYDVCGHHIAGVTAEKKRVDQTEYLDRLVELAACLRAQGIDVDDPDMSAPDPGKEMGMFLKANWDSPAMQKARAACDVMAAFGGGK